MPSKDTFGFGSKPCMKEVPPGAEAVFTFRGDPKLVETEYGEKYSFPITLISHPSYDTLPLNMDWQSKCQSAKQLFTMLGERDLDIWEPLCKAYKNKSWQLTRFDTGAYWIDAL